jgi:hypothetical protein
MGVATKYSEPGTSGAEAGGLARTGPVGGGAVSMDPSYRRTPRG